MKADGGGTFNKFERRVQAAAEAALKSGSVGPLDLLMHMGFIQPVHFEGWQRGIEHYRHLTADNQPLCLTCADMDHLVFLRAGDTALTRRARKHSPLSAVVVRFNRSRKRYERRGLLVTEAAIIQAEDQCAADAPERAAARARAALARGQEDGEFVGELTQFIAQRYPRCPVEEARRIAQHTALRGSGRVGRLAAARELDPKAVDLAVAAHVRHEHTEYDRLLMSGVERMDARRQIRDKIEAVLQKWRT